MLRSATDIPGKPGEQEGNQTLLRPATDIPGESGEQVGKWTQTRIAGRGGVQNQPGRLLKWLRSHLMDRQTLGTNNVTSRTLMLHA